MKNQSPDSGVWPSIPCDLSKYVSLYDFFSRTLLSCEVCVEQHRVLVASKVDPRSSEVITAHLELCTSSFVIRSLDISSILGLLEIVDSHDFFVGIFRRDVPNLKWRLGQVRAYLNSNLASGITTAIEPQDGAVRSLWVSGGVGGSSISGENRGN